jgi:predicted esterase
LAELGCEKVDHQWFHDLGHSVNDEELQKVASWLREVLPAP